MSAVHRNLAEIAEQYRDALGARDATRLPLAPSVRYTENGQTLPLTAGTWALATAPPDEYLTVLDPVLGQAVVMGILHEGEHRFSYATRIRLFFGLVSEIETLIVTRRSALSDHGIVTMAAAHAELAEPAPAGDRLSREQLTHVAHAYLDGVQSRTGSIVPVADACTVRRNGAQTVPLDDALRDVLPEGGALRASAGATVREQVDNGAFAHVSAIDDRRVVAINEERQVVVSCAIYQNPGAVAVPPGVGVDSLPELSALPSSMLALDVLRLAHQQIVAIDTIGVFCPLGTPMGWPVDPVHRVA